MKTKQIPILSSQHIRVKNRYNTQHFAIVYVSSWSKKKAGLLTIVILGFISIIKGTIIVTTIRVDLGLMPITKRNLPSSS
jgi:hypothetical protein